MKSLDDVLKEEMKDPKFRKEWVALEPEFRRIRQELSSDANNSSSPKYEIKQRTLSGNPVALAM